MTGKDLIDLGYKPGKWFKEALLHVNENNVQGEQLIAYLDSMVPKEIFPYENPMPYYENIEALTKGEIDNIALVKKNMDSVMKLPTTIKGAIMPDACPTQHGQIPVGGVVVAKNAIHPSMHSADICCSVMYSNLGKVDPYHILNTAYATTHFGIGGRYDRFNDVPIAILNDMQKNGMFFNDKKAFDLAKAHLGTQGDGNHFLYVGLDEQGNTILITHHGSRALGAFLYKEGVKVAQKHTKDISPKSDSKNAWITFDTKEGQDYWKALQTVRAWTKENHRVLHDAIASKIYNQFWNEHNFVFQDNDLFYHAKGATPLTPNFVPDNPDDPRIIPLNMAEPILLVKGQATGTNLGFAPHGAGRNLSRTQHSSELRLKYPGLTDKEIFKMETSNIDARFFGDIDLSELPSAYKNAEHVQMQIQKFGLGKIISIIQPFGCIMAGNMSISYRKNH